MEGGAPRRKPDFPLTVTGADPLRLSGYPWDFWTYPGKGSGEERDFLIPSRVGSPSHRNLNIKQIE